MHQSFYQSDSVHRMCDQELNMQFLHILAVADL